MNVEGMGKTRTDNLGSDQSNLSDHPIDNVSALSSSEDSEEEIEEEIERELGSGRFIKQLRRKPYHPTPQFIPKPPPPTSHGNAQKIAKLQANNELVMRELSGCQMMKVTYEIEIQKVPGSVDATDRKVALVALNSNIAMLEEKLRKNVAEIAALKK